MVSACPSAGGHGGLLRIYGVNPKQKMQAREAARRPRDDINSAGRSIVDFVDACQAVGRGLGCAASRALLALSSVHLFKRRAPALLDFCRGQVFFVSRHRPPMTEGIGDLGVAIAPELVH